MAFGNRPFWEKKKPRKRPKTKFEKQVARLDYYFSLYIRLSRMDNLGLCVCISCDKQFPWNKNLHAGHFIGKANNTYRTRWDEKNVQPQCARCNSFLEGNKYLFGLMLNKKHGEGTTEKLQIKSTKPFNPMIYDMEENIIYYREKVKELKPKEK